MANNIRKKFTVELEFNAAKAPGQVKKVCGDIDKMLDEAGKKRDFKVFEQLADYIQEVDKRLNDFKTKDGSLFENIFGKDELTNLNAAFKKALDIIDNFFNEYKAEYKAINDQIDLMQKGRIESKADNRRELAQRINTLSEKTGGSASLINLKDVGGKTGDVTSIMNLMRTALQGIDTQWTNLFSAPLDLSKFDQLKRTFRDVDNDVLQLRQHIE
ncbi:MAG TPA: hypothetical protein DCW90_18260, partial [Lachnospiraceae bacterium]|nr:hypothetical protein [Lachnospiraceae bacterium]